MRTLLAAVLLLAAATGARAQVFVDDEDSVDASTPTAVPKPKVTPGKTGAAGPAGSTSTAPGAGMPCQIYPDLSAMPHPNGSGHGILDLTAVRNCVSVGFSITRKESYGICRSGESPVVPQDAACTFTYWISDAPGGPPRSKKCAGGPVNLIGGKVEFGGAYPADCILPVGTYFCNVRAGGFDHPTQPAKRCGGLVPAPLMQRQ